ncbi:MAG: hypothetical protein ABJN34_03470 [Litoreibacter sp.]|uniref:protein-tyrosine phosphatase family protein n=1 Tax=Litoreibacter sp. TaxID=1969459 RepID=UPI003297D51B
MTPSIFPIAAHYPGQLFIMPMPSATNLEACIEHYRAQGVNTVISMLSVGEVEELDLQAEAGICADKRLGFTNFPIEDFGLPEAEGFKALVRDISQRLRNGEGVAVHCRAGIGRSGMLTCCTLAGFLGSAEIAIDTVSRARGAEVPDTKEQRDFIAKISQEMRKCT